MLLTVLVAILDWYALLKVDAAIVEGVYQHYVQVIFSGSKHGLSHIGSAEALQISSSRRQRPGLPQFCYLDIISQTLLVAKPRPVPGKEHRHVTKKSCSLYFVPCRVDVGLKDGVHKFLHQLLTRPWDSAICRSHTTAIAQENLRMARFKRHDGLLRSSLAIPLGMARLRSSPQSATSLMTTRQLPVNRLVIF